MEYNNAGDLVSRKPDGLRCEPEEVADANGLIECVVYFPLTAWEAARDADEQQELIMRYTFPGYQADEVMWGVYEDQEEEPREEIECIQIHARIWFDDLAC